MATTSAYAQEHAQLQAIDGSIIRSASLTLEDYELNVPAGATILGIVLTWTGGASGWDESDAVMKLGDASGGGSDSLSANGTVPEYSTIGTVTFGGPEVLWGRSWTVDQVNGITTTFTAGSGNTGYHDAFQITVHYEEDTTEGPIQLSSGKIIISSGKITIG